MLLSKDSGNLFTVEILVNVKMVDCIFESSPLFSIHDVSFASGLLMFDGMADVAIGRRLGGVIQVTCIDLRKFPPRR
jgi:hypothetical protein